MNGERLYPATIQEAGDFVTLLLGMAKHQCGIRFVVFKQG